jgi:hypothetical protein
LNFATAFLQIPRHIDSFQPTVYLASSHFSYLSDYYFSISSLCLHYQIFCFHCLSKTSDINIMHVECQFGNVRRVRSALCIHLNVRRVRSALCIHLNVRLVRSALCIHLNVRRVRSALCINLNVRLVRSAL